MITSQVLDNYLKNYRVEILSSETIESKHYDFYKKYKVKSKVNGLFFDLELFINFEVGGIYTQYEIKKIYNEYGLLDNTLYYLPKSGFLEDGKELNIFFNENIFLFTPENILNIMKDLQKYLVEYTTDFIVDIDNSKFYINYLNDKVLELEVIYNSNTIFFSINSDKITIKNKKHYTNIINLKTDLDKLLSILIKIENSEDIDLKTIPTSFSEIFMEFDKFSNSFKLIVDDMYEQSQYLEIISDIFLSEMGVIQLSVIIDKPYRVSSYVDYIVKINTINNQNIHTFNTLNDCFEFVNDYKNQHKI